MNVDVLVVGAGLAGLHTATQLALRGYDVVLVDRRSDLSAGIHTTGIFVRKSFDDFDLPRELLGPPIRRVVLYPPNRLKPIVLVSDRDEFRVGDMGGLYAAAARSASQAGAMVMLGSSYAGRAEGGFLVTAPSGPVVVRARFVVGADGARSQVARDLGLDQNTRMLVGAEEVFAVSAGAEPPTFHCVLDPDLAPGYLAWVVNDGHHAHVGLAGHSYPRGLRQPLERFRADAPGLPREVSGRVERRGGLIPVGGVLRRIASREGLLVGDAAGAVSPLTAGGLDPCLRLSEIAVSVLDQALRDGRPDALRSYDGAMLRARFRGRLIMRRAMTSVQTPKLTQAAFAALRTPPGRAAARHILFGDRSFPGPRPSPLRQPRPESENRR